MPKAKGKDKSNKDSDDLVKKTVDNQANLIKEHLSKTLAYQAVEKTEHSQLSSMSTDDSTSTPTYRKISFISAGAGGPNFASPLINAQANQKDNHSKSSTTPVPPRKSSFWIGPKLGILTSLQMTESRSTSDLKSMEITLKCVDAHKSSPHATPGVSDAAMSCVGVAVINPTQRRESFLYRSDSQNVAFADEASPCGPATCSRASSVASDYYITEENFVTPFAQILAGLKNVRNNFVHLTNLPHNRLKKLSSSGSSGGAVVCRKISRAASHVDDVSPSTSLAATATTTSRMALETLDELDWCLEQLESIQTGRSVSEMAESKFQKMLRKELSQLSSSKQREQISRYIFDTFTAPSDHNLESPSPSSLPVSENHQRRNDASNVGASPSTTSASLRATSAPPASQATAAAAASMTASPTRRVAATVSRFCRYGSSMRVTKEKRSGGGTSTTSTSATSQFGVETDDPVAVGELLLTINKWGMDVFHLQILTKNQALVAVAFALFKERDLFRKFSLNVDAFLRYFGRLQDLYRSNPYHNCIHAADVAQSSHVLLSTPALNNVFTDLENMAAIFAAAIHDVDHPGVTNQFLINTSSDLAVLYNDESVLEQHHLAAAFRLLQECRSDFLAPLNKKQRQMLRRVTIDMVLATDMSKHMSLLADFKTTVETKRIAGAGTGVLLLDNYEDRIKVLKNVIHLCDLSNPTKPLRLYTQWTERITEEFWKQGDRERQLGLEPSPICDRNNGDFEKSQVEFIDFIVHPLWETWAEFVYPDANSLLEQIEQNRQFYFDKISNNR